MSVLADGSLNFDTKLDSSGFQKGLSGIGSMASNAFGAVTKGITVAASAAATATGVLVKSAVDGYADYEQLFGGIETLFGNGGKTLQEYADSVGKTVEEVKEEYIGLVDNTWNVVENAEKAFKTAGLSTNEYLETVTSFSASLIQSLNGDTVKAAEKADQAIIDMSDNANKMGSSMESIQNAYQGFAKQNYTMLDNLKLGYGGTKEEMQRLLEDAQAISGIEYDISSYADVVDAIHVIQDEMGIAGTTAKEASSTISGSIASMKASWENLVAGMANEDSDPEALIDNFVESVEIVLENVLPHVEIALYAVGDLIEELLPVIAQRIPEIILELLPTLVDAGMQIIFALISGIQENSENLLSSGAEILLSLISGIIQVIPQLASLAYDIVTSLLTGITENASSVFSSGSELLVELINGIVAKLPDLLLMAVDAIVAMAMAITEPGTLSNIIDAGITLIIGLIEGLMNAIPRLIEAVPTIVANLAMALINNAPKLLSSALQIMTKFGEYMIKCIGSLLKVIPDIFSKLKEKFSSIDWGSIGKNIIEGIKTGLLNAVTGLANAAVEAAKSAFNAAKNFLGIHSPSRKFKWIGEMCVEGFDEPLEDYNPYDTLNKSMKANVDTMKSNFGSEIFGSGTSTTTQTVNIYQPVKSPSETARAIRLEEQYGLAGA